MAGNAQSGPSFLSLENAVNLVNNGSLLAMGGQMKMEPLALVRELVRQGKRQLRLVTVPAGGMGVDLLIGVGCVESVETPQVVLNEFGQAPNFRECVEAGTVRVFDHV